MQLNPSEVKILKVSEKGNVGVFSFDPLPTGFGNTLGNTLRRVALTSLRGGAITQIKIEGVSHQFSTIPGVKEDVIEIGLNFKKVRIKVHGDNPVVGRIKMTGPCEVFASDIDLSSEAEILNKDLLITTLSDKNAKFEAELVVEPGYGYSPVEDRETSKLGVILLDATFSPVVSASYSVEPTRMGRVIGLDKLIFTVETDGSITPSEAVEMSSGILRSFFARFSQGEDEIVVTTPTEVVASSVKKKAVEDASVDDLPLPTRTINALRKHGIKSLSQLMDKTQEELADIKNLGEKSVEEINKLLSKES
ncbi:DNA-directed RNA polymerase subunit alpha [candidate division WWE3 bacterium RIFCSPLOWO2_12_FULL_36_10]|uniref:DNA-directed RNA polymerase subunit alpha n=1 Tax=candidate division WWE3 bacterium RIFCSPLOWO2_12_FULL_36_10 TaxID=1802630 RepID=A0A1F4VGZ4_UNCKA|nr:MAG: DNA-directed RNA polymerase subunit alpha [candidate division WWE3 bacterium RIFCSPLOWO2_12_FULL_36_10]